MSFVARLGHEVNLRLIPYTVASALMHTHALLYVHLAYNNGCSNITASRALTDLYWRHKMTS